MSFCPYLTVRFSSSSYLYYSASEVVLISITCQFSLDCHNVRPSLYVCPSVCPSLTVSLFLHISHFLSSETVKISRKCQYRFSRDYHTVKSVRLSLYLSFHMSLRGFSINICQLFLKDLYNCSKI